MKKILTSTQIVKVIEMYKMRIPPIRIAERFAVHHATIYRALHKAGIKIFDKTPEERFWENVRKTNYCWLWNRKPINTGYGRIRFGIKDEVVHRIAWIIFHGAIPLGACVLHKCDNRICVNPKHLFLGDRADNNRDASRKHRLIGNRKINFNVIHAIRQRYVNEMISQATLGREFNISNGHISRIVRFRQRMHH